VANKWEIYDKHIPEIAQELNAREDPWVYVGRCPHSCAALRMCIEATQIRDKFEAGETLEQTRKNITDAMERCTLFKADAESRFKE
jgi:hypothetical protein